ncbi:MAG: nitrous oxide reductase family maturation protein NosD [Ignavibacteriae bacterium]|nr:nitrous oxide reductase family maturation protein NosD [Ignavibacteriota bacterium]
MSIRNGTKFLLLFILFITFNNNFCKTFNVGKDKKYSSIKTAISSASSGDTLLIQTGIYTEGNIIIDKPLTIIGLNQPIIDGQNKFENITVTSSDVLISGLKLINSGVSFIDDNAAIKLEEVKNCTVINNEFDQNFFAIYLAKSSDCKIFNNKIYATKKSEASSGNGIHLWYCKNITIENNFVNGHRDGIYLEFARTCHINKNLSENNLRYGLHFMFSDSCSYTSNTFKHNGAGVAVMYTKYVEMTNNRFENNWGSASYGILLKDITDSKITNNYFYRNSSGIYIEGSNRIIVYKNEFMENGWAIRLMANSMDNTFTQNNFIGNSFDIATNSTQSYNEFNNNFWSEYQGYDIDKNGIGDIPYRPVKLFSLIVEKNRPTLILLRSLFVDILDAAERIFPVLTPETLIDNSPSMKRIL